MINSLPSLNFEEKHCAALEEENAMLLEQLQVVQEELEKRSLGINQKVTVWCDDELLEIVSENLHRQALLAVLQEVRALESQNSLSNRLGNLLLQSVDSPLLLLALPNKLQKIWREWTRTKPPKQLGGNGYDNIIAAYHSGGFSAVDTLLTSCECSSNIQAEALTTLARSLLHTEVDQAAEAAHRAFAIDPRPFRLKWLAFRLHEAGNAVKAEALLTILPQDMHFSGSEVRQANRLRHEARQARLREAKQSLRYPERLEAFENQMRALANERHVQQTRETQQELQILQENLANLEAEKSSLAKLHNQQIRLAATQLADFETLQQQLAELKQERILFTEQVATLETERAVLTEKLSTLEKTVMELEYFRDQESRRVAEQQSLLFVATRDQLQAEKEKLELTTQLSNREREIETLSRSRESLLATIAGRADDVAKLTDQQKEVLNDKFKEQSDDFLRMQKNILNQIKREIINSRKQFEAVFCLHNYFATGELPYINTEYHSWPVSPDFALYLVELIENKDYQLIIEFGSGLSTINIAKTLATVASRRHNKVIPTFISFDHLDTYYQKTYTHLKQAGLTDKVQLHLSPLQEYVAADGKIYPYYACQGILKDAAAQHSAAATRILVVVDGPPASTGLHARYPAAPIILNHFPSAQVDLLLDDYIRSDEQEIAQLWQSELGAANRSFSIMERKLEKNACLISIIQMGTGEI